MAFSRNFNIIPQPHINAETVIEHRLSSLYQVCALMSKCTRSILGRYTVMNVIVLHTAVKVVATRIRALRITRTSSPTLTIPCSTRPVTTVPRPAIENTSSIGIRNGLSKAGSRTNQIFQRRGDVGKKTRKKDKKL